MKQERLMAAMYDKFAVDAAFENMKEEEAQKMLDDCANRDVSIAIGAYLVEHMGKMVRCDEIEYEWPYEDHPEHVYVYVTISVEE